MRGHFYVSCTEKAYLYFVYTIVVANLTLGIADNALAVRESFSWNRLWHGVLKGLLFGIGSTLVAAVITVVIQAIDYYAVPIKVDLTSINILAFVSIFAFGIIDYLIQCFTKIRNIVRYNQIQNNILTM